MNKRAIDPFPVLKSHKQSIRAIRLRGRGGERATLIPGNIWLAPLAGWSDPAFREICLSWGAFFTFTEMISAEGCVYNNKKIENLLKRSKREKQ